MTFVKENWPFGTNLYLECHIVTISHWPCQLPIGRASWVVSKSWKKMSFILGLSSYTDPVLDPKNLNTLNPSFHEKNGKKEWSLPFHFILL